MESLVSSQHDSWLPWFLRGVLILGFLFLVGRLIELQIIKGSYFRGLSEGDRIRRIPIVAARGRILARGGETLAGNHEVKSKIAFDAEAGLVKIKSDDSAQADETIVEWERDYPLGAKFAHVSGYLGEVGPDEVGKINPECPERGPRELGTWVGKDGLEAQYECLLAGISGEEMVEVDSRGWMVRILGKKESTPGQDLKTSIDFALQNSLSDFMTGEKGAVVALDPAGEILALYSSPSFDPNIFIKSADSQKISQILSDDNLPLLNRAIGGQYHPGSVFKPVVAVAALAEGRIDKNYIFADPGVITIGEFSYTNWFFSQYGQTEGRINLVRALARSTDTFFYKLGEIVGIDKLVDWAESFGYGKKTGIDLAGEVAGLVPSPEWKLKTKDEAWFLGNTYHFAIGQGDLTATPLQVALETDVIANGGKLCQPKIAFFPGARENCADLKIKTEDLNLVGEGMQAVCNTGGTGYTFFDSPVKIACKTGTAETNLDGKTHAWFTLFAPAENPQITLTVLVEGGGEGSKIAGPIARKIIDVWRKTASSETAR